MKKWQHQYWYKELSAYLDKELTDKKKNQFEKHLSHCSRCQYRLKNWEKNRLLYRSISKEIPSEQLWLKIEYRLKEEPVRPLPVWESDWLSRWIPNPIPSVAIAIGFLILVWLLQPYFYEPAISEISLEQYLTTGTELASINGFDLNYDYFDELNY